MPIFKFLFSFRGRTRRAERPAGAKAKRAVKQPKSAKAMSAAIQMRAPAAQESESTSRSVLPRAPGAAPRATFGTLKPRTFGRGPTRG